MEPWSVELPQALAGGFALPVDGEYLKELVDASAAVIHALTEIGNLLLKQVEGFGRPMAGFALWPLRTSFPGFSGSSPE